MCWRQLWDVGDDFDCFHHRHPKNVTNIEIPPLTPDNCHQHKVTIIYVPILYDWIVLQICQKVFSGWFWQFLYTLQAVLLIIFISVEELQESLKLFEAVLPRYFHGAITIQSQGEEKIKNDTFTLNKKSLSEESATFLREKTSISLEYDLYNFVASRFSEMKSQYGISWWRHDDVILV